MSLPPLILTGMYGIGDNLHQRAIVKALIQHHDVWLETCHVALYHDLLETGNLQLLFKPTQLRAQRRTIELERKRYPNAYQKNAHRPRGRDVETKRLWYHKVDIGRFGPIMMCMFGVLGLPIPERPDWSLPIKPEWTARALDLMHGSRDRRDTG